MINVGTYVMLLREDGIVPATTIGIVTNNEQYEINNRVVIKVLVSPKLSILDCDLYISNENYTELNPSSIDMYLSRPSLKATEGRLTFVGDINYIPNCYSKDSKLRFSENVKNNFPQEIRDGRKVGSVTQSGLGPWGIGDIIVDDEPIVEGVISTNTDGETSTNGARPFRSFRDLYNVSGYEGSVKYTDKPEKPREKLSMDEPVTTEQLLELFKFVPIKINNRYGFYDHKTSKIVTFGKDYYGKDNTIVQTGCTADESIDLSYRFNIQPLFQYCKFKVKSCDKSSTLFRFGALKRSLIGKELPATQLAINVKVNNSEELQNTIFMVTGTRNTRFALEDIEIIYPNINGYYPKADRNISTGSKVKVINDKHMNYLKKGDTTKVESLKKIGYKTYAGIKVNDKIIYERLNKFKKIC